tara:strand:- start:779 stop:1201 length:423 start_codon:yes stop_codon:yes gene_type:complete
MKVWIREFEDDRIFGTESFDKPDGKEVSWIAPTEDDPAVIIPSDRTDGYEHIVWHDVTYLVQSVDLEFEGERTMTDKQTAHCLSCDSRKVQIHNVVQEWDVETQDFEDTDSPEGYIFYCPDCGMENSECVYKSIDGALVF